MLHILVIRLNRSFVCIILDVEFATVYRRIYCSKNITLSNQTSHCICKCILEYRDHTCFPCINICRVPRMLFEHEGDRPSVQTSSEGPGKCKCNVTNMCDRYSCILYLIPTKFALKTLLKHYIVRFLKTKWRRLCTVERRHTVKTVRNVFANKNIGEIISLIRNAFRIK